jgi:Xaa-Pro aminopeptidase
MKLITNLTNIKYLINFSGSNGFMILGKKNYFFTDFRYKEIAKKLQKSKSRTPFKFIELDKNFDEIIKDIVNGKLEFENHIMTMKQLEGWQKKLKKINFEPIRKTIEEVRAIKDKKEIEYLKKSQLINEETLELLKTLFKRGMTEKEIAWRVKSIGHELGAEDISFEPIIAFGSNSSTPHHQNTDRRYEAGDLVLIDMGMKYKGYCSDMTRTIFTARPTREQEAVYKIVLDSQLAGIAAIKAGVKCKDVDKAARKVMGPLQEYFGHSLGHGIGLDVHEMPSLSGKSTEILKENMIVTVEPGIYLEGKFGVRIEDMGRVTRRGYENFTMAPK